MFRQFTFAQQLSIRVPDGLSDLGILDRGDALAMQILDALQYSVALLLRRRRRYEIEDCIHCGFLQYPRGQAAGIAIDRSGGWILGGSGYICQMQRRRIAHTVVSGRMHQPHWIVRRNAVKICSGDVAPFGELALVPTVSLQPFAGFQPCNSRLHAPYHFGDGRGIAEMNVIQLFHSGIGDMRVAIDEARCRGAAMQIDTLSAGAREPQNIPIGADGDDFPVADRQAFRNRVVRIHGEDPAVE
jgi:hypothetical protein